MTAKALLAQNPNPTRERDPGGARGQPLPLHRLPADLRSGRRRRARSCARRREIEPEAALRRRRQAAPPRRRPRQGHRASRASPTTCRCRACCTAKLLRSPHPHAPIEAIDLGRRRSIPACTSSSPARTSRCRSASCRSSQDEHPLAPRARALRRRSGRRGDRDATSRRPTEALGLDRGGVRGTSDRSPIRPRRRCRTPSRASTTTATRATSSNAVLEFGDVDGRSAGADHVFEDMFFYEGNTHLPMEQHATVAVARPATASCTSGPRARRRRTTCTARWRRCCAMPARADPRHRHAQRRRLRRQERSRSTTRSWCRKAALMLGRPVKICLTREEVFYCHRGRHPVLMR